MVHILGLERLFALHGPSMTEYGTILDHVLLETCRPLMILAAFFTQRPSLMGEPKWRAITQTQETDGSPSLFQSPAAVSDISFLMDILAELPALFIQCNKCIRLAKTKQPNTHVSIIWSRAKQLQRKLQSWKTIWDDNHQNEVYEALPNTAIDSTQTVAWTTVYTFSCVELANTFTMYHTVVILLTGIPISLRTAGLEPPCSICTTSDHSSANLSQSLIDIEISVQKISRSIEYYLQFVQPSQAPADFYLFFPLHVARRAATQLGLPSQLAWLADAFETARSRYPMGLWANMDFADHFSGLQEGLFG